MRDAARSRQGWTRRAALAAAGAAGAAGTLAGCSWWDDEPEPDPPDPLEPLVTTTHALVVRYARTRAVHPDLAERLAPLQAAHEQHLAALREAIGMPDPDTTPSAVPSATPTALADVPTGADAAVEALRDAEQHAQQEAAQACLAAPSGRAMLLGSVCAARASHQEVLP